MATSVYLPESRKVRANKKKIEEKHIYIISATYLKDFSIALHFSNQISKVVDFLPLFLKYAKGANSRYFALENFKKFMVKNGNIYWGKNEDEFAKEQNKEVLYIVN